MAFRIGFTAEQPEGQPERDTYSEQPKQVKPRRCVADICFESRHLTLSYYNDAFDLHPGDLVYVEGKLEGQLGRVVTVNYNFKIKLSDYKRVICVVDTSVNGRFCIADSHFITFDEAALPKEKATSWLIPPATDTEDYICGNDDTFYPLNDLNQFPVSGVIANRGCDYYAENRVTYLCLDGEDGYAIVSGSKPYEVEFTYADGEIGNLTCTCFCNYHCKHEVAVLLQLRELLDRIEERYAAAYESTGYFAAVTKSTFFRFVIANENDGSFTL